MMDEMSALPQKYASHENKSLPYRIRVGEWDGLDLDPDTQKTKELDKLPTLTETQFI